MLRLAHRSATAAVRCALPFAAPRSALALAAAHHTAHVRTFKEYSAHRLRGTRKTAAKTDTQAAAADPAAGAAFTAAAAVPPSRARSSKGPVSLPRCLSADHLAHLLRVPLKQLCKDAARVFAWWPKVTARSLKKESFGSVKEMLLTFDEAAEMARFLKREPQLRDIEAEEAAFAASRPFGAESMQPRPPVVAILGHKDHGKTTLLDRLRGGNIAEKEDFGVTQETYAFNVNLTRPEATTAAAPSAPSATSSVPTTALPSYPFSFLDTPGHVSFTDMRHQVASVSDLLLLVVAADEGVLDQTFEVLRLARATERPLVVVINKMDLPSAKKGARAIRKELKELGAKIHSPAKPVVSTKGDLVVLELSATKDDTNLSVLRQVLIDVTQSLQLRADSAAVPEGVVVESMQSPGRGGVVRVVLTQGTLKVGQAFTVEGVYEGRVKDIRSMRSSSASGTPESLAFAKAGVTVDIQGAVALPNPGAEFRVYSSLENAKLAALTARNEVQYADQARVRDSERARSVAERDDAEEDAEVDEDEFDEVEEVDELPSPAASTAAPRSSRAAPVEEDFLDDDEDEVPEGAVAVPTDPRGRVAPPWPERSSWELSPAPPPTQRAMPLANLRPKFKFYSLQADESPVGDDEDEGAGVTAIEPLPQSADGGVERRFGLNVLLKAASMGALRMLRTAIDELNQVNVARGLPEIHVSYAAAGDVSKKDLVNAEAEGCWVYSFRVARPAKPAIQQARSRHVPLFAFKHHQHLLDHLQQHIEASPVINEQGEAKLDENQQPIITRRSHPSVQ